MKLAIIGSRTFNDYEKMCDRTDKFIQSHGKPETIISGGATGADTLAERYAAQHNIPTEIYLPEYSKYGQQAPLERNTTIVEQCTHLLAFPTPESRGTWDTVRKAMNLELTVTVIK